MNGPSISRRPVGRKSIGQAPSNVAPQQPVFPGPPGVQMSTAPAYVPGQMTSQSAPYQAGPYYTAAPMPPVSGQTLGMQPGAQASTHWPSSSTTYQGPAYSVPPPQTPAYVPAPVQTPGPRPTQSPMAHAAQVRASIVAPSPQPGPQGPVGPRPGQMSSPAPSMVQNFPSPTGINMANPGQAAPMAAPSPMAPQLQRLNTTHSVQSLASDFDRRLSMSSNASVGTPLTTFSTPDQSQQAIGTPGGNSRACASCKQDSDLRVQERVGYILPQQWTIRKNASGRLWYTYNETGYRTHIQPLTGVVYEMDVDVGIPPGWQQMKTPEGKVYFYNQSTHASSWTKPKNEIPQGWKVYKTPDGVLFYVNEALRLSTWDRPGEQPKPRSMKSSPSGPPTPAAGAATAGPVARINSNNQVRPDKATKAASKMVMAANVANNVAKLSAASDMSPSGFLTAGVAAAKLTGIGLKVAGKKVGNLGKRRNMYAAANLIGAAATVTGALDGDYDPGYFQVDEVEEVEEVEVTQTTEISTDQATYFATESEPTYITTEQTFIQQEAFPQQGAFMMTQDQFLPGQQTSYYVDQMSYSYDQTLGMPPDQMQLPQEDTLSQEPPVVINNVNVTVQETLVNETTTVQDTEYTDNILFVETSQNSGFNQYVRQDAVITDFSDLSWADPPSLCNAQEPPAPLEPQFIETQVQEPPEVSYPPEIVQQPQIIQPPQPMEQSPVIQQPTQVIEQPDIVQQPLVTGQPEAVQQPLSNEQPQSIQQPEVKYTPEDIPPAPPAPPEMPQAPQFPDCSTVMAPSSQACGGAPPLVFEPVLAAPLMGNQPTEQSGMIYPTDTASLI